MKQEIYDMIKMTPHTSFVELSKRIPNFNGEYEYCRDDDGYNVVFWGQMSKKAIEALEELRQEKKIFAHHASELVYLFDGGFLTYPVLKKVKKTKEPHWIPLTFCTFPQEYKKPSRKKR